jgi:hypothetical protein
MYVYYPSNKYKLIAEHFFSGHKPSLLVLVS